MAVLYIPMMALSVFLSTLHHDITMQICFVIQSLSVRACQGALHPIGACTHTYIYIYISQRFIPTHPHINVHVDDLYPVHETIQSATTLQCGNNVKK